jgi:NADPH:quinone reductase-like Zn-dependent oxidoreductase
MKAIIFHHHGGPEVLEYTDFPKPERGLGEVLVKFKAAVLNRRDFWVREGWPRINLEYPHIPGADGAGEVILMGPNTAPHHPGLRPL